MEAARVESSGTVVRTLKPFKLIGSVSMLDRFYPAKMEHWDKQKAREALAKFEFDRPLDTSVVIGFREAMERGLWDPFNPSQIALMFDENGNRLNGKHRLTAFLDSKLDTLDFPVVRGLPRTVYGAIDQDAKGRQKQAAFPGHPHATRDTARMTAFHALLTGQVRAKPTNPVLRDLMRKWSKELEWAGEVMRSGGGTGRQSAVAAFLYVYGADETFATRMATSWTSGMNLTSRLTHLRDTIMVKKRGGFVRERACDLTFKLLDALAAAHLGSEKGTHAPMAGLRYFSDLLHDGVAQKWGCEPKPRARKATH